MPRSSRSVGPPNAELPALPQVEELSLSLDATQVFRQLAQLPHCLYLDSARREPALGRYSFVAADPFDFLQLGVDQPGGLDRLEAQMQRWRSETVAKLPPFQGGDWATIWADNSNPYRHPGTTNSKCPFWPSAFTTWWWPSTTLRIEPGSFRRAGPKPSRLAVSLAPDRAWPSFDNTCDPTRPQSNGRPPRHFHAHHCFRSTPCRDDRT